jgi:hypothetical protein
MALVGCQATEPELSVTEQHAVVLVPSTADFGSVQVGQTSAAVSLRISPAAGAQYDVINSVTASCPDFVLDTPGVPGAAVIREIECDTCTLCTAAPRCYTVYQQDYYWTAAFRPTVGQAVSCPVTFNFTSGPKTVTLTGTGVLPPIDIDVQPTSLAFGDVRVNTPSSARTLTVRNLGGQTLTVNSISVPSPTYQLSGATSYTVPPTGSVSHSLTCTPSGVGAQNGTLVINSNDPATPTINVSLTCAGIDSNLDISPSPLTIPTTRVGEPLERAITLRNTGGASMVLSSVSLTGANLELINTPMQNLTLGPNQETSVTVRFNAAASGDASGTLSATYDGGQARTSQISARALTTSIAVTPDGSVELGPVCIGQSKQQAFSVIANAEASFDVDAITTPAEPFTIATPALPATVQGAGANNVTFTVTATPTTTGRVSSTFDLTTDIPNGTPKTIELTVEGLTEGVSGTPELLDFGSAEPDTTSIGQPVHVSNCSTTPVTMSNPRIEGANASEFAIVANPPSTTIEPAGTASWLVISSLDSAGLKEAQFAVDYDGGTVTIALAAEGLGDGVLDGGDLDGVRPSYYACSTGGPAGAAPITLAFLGLFLRRRHSRR